MWDFLARQLLKQAGRKIGNSFFNDEANGPEVYADRIKRDFHLHDYADAWALYDSDRAYWENYYHPRPSGPAWNNELVRDSAAAAGIPGRNNVVEYELPEPNPAQSSTGEVPPVRILSHPAWYNEFVRDSAAAAGVPGRNNVFEYGFPDSGPARTPLGQAPSARRSAAQSSPQMAPDVANSGQLPPTKYGLVGLDLLSRPARDGAAGAR